MSQFVPPITEEILDHPLCPATMACMRGPCQHYWTMISRLKAPGTIISIKHSQACRADPEMDLNEENIYSCSHWWPAFLTWIPQSARSALRPSLVQLYEGCLALAGYDMSWKTWKNDTFESSIRKNLKLGAQDE